MKIGTEYYFYQNDHLGTPQKLTSVSGAVVWSAKYNSFGKATIEVETISNNLRFPGQYEDAESGLYYNFNRYYNPKTGRYLRKDPIGLRGGMNLFVYALNNPVSLIDPSGLRYSSEDCVALYNTLMDQLRILQSWRQAIGTGRPPTVPEGSRGWGEQGGSFLVVDCYLHFRDPGSQAVCVAHEMTHWREGHYIEIIPPYLRGDYAEYWNRRAVGEVEATAAGINRGVNLWMENCDCRN